MYAIRSYYALEEDVKRSLAAGVNTHLNKPIVVEKLYATMLGILDPQSVVPEITEAVPMSGKATLDRHKGVQHVNGNTALYSKLLGDFKVQYRDALQTWQQLEGEEAARFLHTFKGTSGMIGALALAGALEQLEKEGDRHLEAAQGALEAVLALIDTESVSVDAKAGAKSPMSPEAEHALLDELKAALSTQMPQKIRPLLERLEAA